ncbi:TIGR01906 family membrane protein [Haloimpatiens sp. FM7330]|uniref:TIGR01906 family membrane protein n=1 Tax=Haloimpatiens sp. FM7330 TaxID=3298610 RepID=UPI00364219A6
MNKFTNIVLNLIQTILLSLFIILSSIYITINFKQLYYYSIDHFNIEQFSNINKHEIKLNYDYTINYLTSNRNINFNLPTLPYSYVGKLHFEEVKALIITSKKILYITLFILILLNIFLKKHTNFLFLKLTYRSLILFCFLLFGSFLLNFDKSFTFFHNIFFNNDYWIFNEKTDPIINILPQEFFCICAFFILFLIILNCIVLMIIHKKISSDVS